jgi:uncharacterized protein (DUF305 family)
MKTLLSSATLTAVLTVLTACSSGPAHNDADVEFAQQMIPHHQQAIQMSDMAEVAAGPEVQRLAARIKDAQGPEIAQMKGWLRAWDEPAGTGGMPMGTDGMDGMDGMGHGVPGMMTGRQMRDLRDAKGNAYDRIWLRMMIAHHRGAIDMAKTEIADGEYPGAITLARAIVKAQTDEIEEMQGMLK